MTKDNHMEPVPETTAVPTAWLIELCEWAVGHGKTKIADEIADMIEGDA